MTDDRADVELTTQIGMETDEEVMAVLLREAKKAAKRALARGADLPEYVDETQWCSGAMRVTVRRPHRTLCRLWLKNVRSDGRGTT